MSKALESDAHSDRPVSTWQVILALTSLIGAIGAFLFLPAGRLDWVAAWFYLAIVTANFAINYVYLRKHNPELIEHRMRFQKGTKWWDTLWLGLFVPLFIAVHVVAGLDIGRFGWSTMSVFWWPIGLLVFSFGAGLLLWAMVVNPFFEKTVRIQSERGHRVIDTGPYRYLRHPGYVGFFGWILSAPLLLGSWWAFIPAILTVVAFFIRTALEDRTLREELPGYVEYAGRVRYRLIPNVW